MIESIEYVYNMYTTATAQLLCLYIVLAFGVRRWSSAAPAVVNACISCMEAGTSGLEPMTLFQLIILYIIYNKHYFWSILLTVYCSAARFSGSHEIS